MLSICSSLAENILPHWFPELHLSSFTDQFHVVASFQDKCCLSTHSSLFIADDNDGDEDFVGLLCIRTGKWVKTSQLARDSCNSQHFGVYKQFHVLFRAFAHVPAFHIGLFSTLATLRSPLEKCHEWKCVPCHITTRNIIVFLSLRSNVKSNSRNSSSGGTRLT